MNPRLLFTILAMSFLVACGACNQHPSDIDEDCAGAVDGRISISQGVWGQVMFWSGDFEPYPPTGHIDPVVRTVHIHRLTTLDDVVSPIPAFYSEIWTEEVVEVTSDDCGFYQAALPPGAYSVFVREDSLFYANSLSGHGNIQSVVVDSGRVSERRIEITYAATL